LGCGTAGENVVEVGARLRRHCKAHATTLRKPPRSSVVRGGAGPRPPPRRLPVQSSLPCAKAECSSHIVPAFDRRVAGERMDDEAVRGGRINFDRETAIDMAVAGTWCYDIAPRHTAAESARHDARIERHRAASPCEPLR